MKEGLESQYSGVIAEMPQSLVFRRAIQVVVEGILNEKQTQDLACLRGVEEALIVIQHSEVRREAFQLITKKLGKRHVSLQRRYDSLSNSVFEEQREDLCEARVNSLFMLPQVCAVLAFLRKFLKEADREQALDDLSSAGAIQVQTAVVERRMQLEYGERNNMERIIEFDPEDVREKRGALSSRYAHQLLKEHYVTESVLLCLSREDTIVFLQEKMGIEAEAAKKIANSVSTRIQKEFRKRLEENGENNGVIIDASEQGNEEGIPFCFLETKPIRLLDADQRRRLGKLESNVTFLQHNLALIYLNMLFSLPDEKSTVIPSWDKGKIGRMGNRHEELFRENGIVFIKPEKLETIFTRREKTAYGDRKYMVYDDRPFRELRDREREPFRIQYDRLRRVTGAVLGDVNKDSLQKILSELCARREWNLHQAIDYFCS